MIKELATESEKVELKMNPEKKTRVMMKGKKKQDTIGDTESNYSYDNIYLGQATAQMREELERRIANGCKKYWSFSEKRNDDLRLVIVWNRVAQKRSEWKWLEEDLADWIDQLSVKCLLYSDDHVIFVSLACQEMVTKINDSVKKRGMKVNMSETKTSEINTFTKIFEFDKPRTFSKRRELTALFLWNVNSTRYEISTFRVLVTTRKPKGSNLFVGSGEHISMSSSKELSYGYLTITSKIARPVTSVDSSICKANRVFVDV
ncbi:hypothetical protein EVAR_82002_1 [Eumeta japonica]|uniref:Reverse transcriptase domain-containing protein n=1 Tax=Eumeta variegata TaxID=151549 RepID=A0A4C1VVX9_EUMVA|nr:hypothetical protein EVAR_82002_1 [Eumeta japonica]